MRLEITAETQLRILAKEIRERRIAGNFSQTALAEAIGTTVKNLNNFERCRNFPSLIVYIALCEVLCGSKPPMT